MTPAEYFENFVLPSAREYCGAEDALTQASNDNLPTDGLELTARRKAANAAYATWHMADWVWEQMSTPSKSALGVNSLNDYRKRLEQNYCDYLRNGDRCDDFNLIGSVADAFKHFKLKNKNREIASADAVVGLSSGWGEVRWGEGKWGGAPQVMITQRDGSTRAFSAVLQNSVDMWRRALGLPLPDMGEF